MKITRVSYQKKNPNLVNLFIDDKFECALSVDLLVKLSLKKGDEISEIDLRSIKSESNWQKWIDKCLNYISIRPRSEKEVKEYIKSKLFKYKKLGILENYSTKELEQNTELEKKELGIKDSSELVDSLVKYLKDRKYLDDFEFAKFLISARTNSSNPRGKNYIKSELISKGVASDIINGAFTAIFEDEQINEKEVLVRAVDKAFSRYSKLSGHNLKQKVCTYLLRRGYDYTDFKPFIDEKIKV